MAKKQNPPRLPNPYLRGVEVPAKPPKSKPAKPAEDKSAQ